MRIKIPVKIITKIQDTAIRIQVRGVSIQSANALQIIAGDAAMKIRSTIKSVDCKKRSGRLLKKRKTSAGFASFFLEN